MSDFKRNTTTAYSDAEIMARVEKIIKKKRGAEAKEWRHVQYQIRKEDKLNKLNARRAMSKQKYSEYNDTIHKNNIKIEKLEKEKNNLLKDLIAQREKIKKEIGIIENKIVETINEFSSESCYHSWRRGQTKDGHPCEYCYCHRNKYCSNSDETSSVWDFCKGNMEQLFLK
jgi:vacuolar-type H+-ATPase subunit I/STV1